MGATEDAAAGRAARPDGTAVTPGRVPLAWDTMDAAQALADLTEISSQIEGAVLFDEGGAVLGSTLGSDEAAQGVAQAAAQLLEGAPYRDRGGHRQTDGARRIAATTGPAPTVGLVFYDLKSCLRNATAEPPKPKRPRRTKPDDEA